MVGELLKWENLKQVLEEYAIALRNKYQDNLIDNNHFTQNMTLLDSVKYIIETDNNSIEISLSLEDYWKYVEFDTKPHFPPVDKIREWIKIKPVIPYEDKNGRLPSESQLAFLIGRKIATEGTTGTKDLENAIKDINEQYEELIGLAIEADIKDSLSIVFSEFLYSK